jgi:hypothetical protein
LAIGVMTIRERVVIVHHHHPDLPADRHADDLTTIPFPVIETVGVATIGSGTGSTTGH